MKTKLLSLGLALAMGAVLVACDGGMDEAAATPYLNNALSSAAICFLNGSGTTLVQTGDGTNNLNGANNDEVKVAKSIAVRGESGSDRQTVTLTWSYDEEAYGTLIAGIQDVPATEEGGEITHQLITFDYEAIEGDSATVVFDVEASLGEFKKAASYTCVMTPSGLEYDAYTIAELYETGSDGRYAFIGKSNNDSSYYYVSTRGYVVGYLPDGNTALIADGDHYITVYAGSGTALLPTNYPALVVGNLVEVFAETAGYYGSPQLSYVQKIQVVEDATVAQPADYITLTDTWFAGLTQYDGNCHRRVTFSGTYMGNLRDQNGNTISEFTPGARCTFDVKVGNATVTVAYNYHCNKGGGTIGDQYKRVIGAATAGSTTLTIKGTLAWASGENTWEVPENGVTSGEYQVMPWNSDDIA